MKKSPRIKTKLHQPRHIYADDTVTFISASTYKKASYLDTAYKKSYLLTKIRETLSEFGYQFYAWVILDNHYHILFKTKMGKDLGKVIRTIHGNSSHHFNKLEDKQGRRFWQSYWDRCIRNEDDFYRHFNYIHHNPVKHGYIARMEDYPFSSLKYWIEKKGEEWVCSAFEQYPILDYTDEKDR